MEALGIVALILSVLGIFTPYVGMLIAALSGLFAIFSCKFRNTYALAAVILNLVNMIFLSPKVLLVVLSSNKPRFFDTSEIKYIFLTAVLIQIVAIIIYVKNKHRKLITNT
ncbi:hypothetical protein ACP3VW_09610 [Vibrio sp. DNB22_17_1]